MARTYLEAIGNRKEIAREIIGLYGIAGADYHTSIALLLRAKGIALRRHHYNELISDLEAGNKAVCMARPQILQIVLTNRCNINCIMCNRVRRDNETMAYGAFSNMWSLLPFVSRISWEGGEVFVVDYFIELLSRITAEFPHIRHEITTNGLLIDEKTAVLLAEMNADIMFSVDSVNKQNYESIRVNGSFDTLLKNLEFIGREYEKRDNSYFLINTVVMKRNMDELRYFPDFCRKYRVNTFNFGYLRSSLIPGEDMFQDGDRELMSRLIRNLNEAKEGFAKYGIRVGGDLEGYLGGRAAGEDAGASKAGRGKAVPAKCMRPWQQLAIGYDGKVMPACECSVAIGTINNEDLGTIWNSEQTQRYRTDIISPGRGSVCAGWCIKGLPPVNYETGINELTALARG